MKGADYNKVEQKMAKRDGATAVKNSGRGERKGDARSDHLLIDYKFTSKGSFSLNLEKFKKHEKDAWREQLQVAIVVVYENYGNKRIAMVDYDWLLEIMEDYGNYMDLRNS